MEMKVGLHSNCCSHYLQPPSASLTSLPLFTKPIHFPYKTKSPSPLPIRPSSICAVQNEQVPGVNAKVVEVDLVLAVKDKAANISTELKGTSIFLLGLNCTIKTNLGRLLADALRYYYFDSDSLVEQAGGDKSGTKSFKERDEKGFLETESEVLKQLSSMGRLVVCTGDGAVQSSTNLAFLRYGISVWIDVPIHMVSREYSTSDTTKVSAQLSEQYEKLREGYGTADASISLQKIACQLGYESMDAVTIEDMAIEVEKKWLHLHKD